MHPSMNSERWNEFVPRAIDACDIKFSHSVMPFPLWSSLIFASSIARSRRSFTCANT